MRLLPLYILLFAGIIVVFYLSWLPSPKLGIYGILPGWLVKWVDDDVNMNLRTAVPFVFLGLLTGSYLVITRKAVSWWLASWLGLVAVVILAEAGQLMRPNRSFDVGDIMWGGLGALAGMFFMGLLALVMHSRRNTAHNY